MMNDKKQHPLMLKKTGVLICGNLCKLSLSATGQVGQNAFQNDHVRPDEINLVLNTDLHSL